MLGLLIKDHLLATLSTGTHIKHVATTHSYSILHPQYAKHRQRLIQIMPASPKVALVVALLAAHVALVVALLAAHVALVVPLLAAHAALVVPLLAAHAALVVPLLASHSMLHAAAHALQQQRTGEGVQHQRDLCAAAQTT